MRSIFFLLALGTLLGLSCTQNSNLKEGKNSDIEKHYVVPYRVGDLFGFSNSEGKVLVEPLYESAYVGIDGYGRMYRDGMCGLVSPQGKIILEPKYDYIGSFYGNRASFMIANQLSGYIDTSGKEIIPASFDYAWDFQRGRAIVKKGNAHLLINESGETVASLARYIPFFGDPYLDGTNANSVADQSYFLVSEEKSLKVGLVNLDGKFTVPAIYDMLSTPVDNVLIAKKGDSYGLLNTEGRTVTAFQYDGIHRLTPEYYAASKNNKYGILDVTGKEILPFSYDYISYLGAGHFAATQIGLTGVINTKGDTLVDFQYAGIFSEKGYWMVSDENGRYGVLDLKANLIIPIQYQHIQVLKNRRFLVQLNDKYGIVDEKNRSIVPIEYDLDHYPGEGDFGYYEMEADIDLVLLFTNQQGYLYNTEGKKVSDKLWTSLGYPNDFGLYYGVDANGRESYLNSRGFEYAQDPKIQTFEVKNIEQFLEAIGSDRVIKLAPGEYDLGKFSFESDNVKPNIFMDQQGLSIANVRNLKIIGPAHLYTGSPYIPVIQLENVHGISLVDLKIGHYPESGYCEGAVIRINHANYFTCEKCDLYGSGTMGIEGTFAHRVVLKSSIIRDCNYSILSLTNCFDCGVYDCVMKDNKEFDMVVYEGTNRLTISGTKFYNCKSTNQYGVYSFFKSSSSYEKLELLNCIFEKCEAHYFHNYKQSLLSPPNQVKGFTFLRDMYENETDLYGVF